MDVSELIVCALRGQLFPKRAVPTKSDLWIGEDIPKIDRNRFHILTTLFTSGLGLRNGAFNADPKPESLARLPAVGYMLLVYGHWHSERNERLTQASDI